jgi:hypothetical protein
MIFHLSEHKLACVVAVVLTGLAMLIVFGLNPGGFETQGAWLFVLLPAGLAVYPLLEFIGKNPRIETAAFWILMGTFNFLWYWMLSFALLLVYSLQFAGEIWGQTRSFLVFLFARIKIYRKRSVCPVCPKLQLLISPALAPQQLRQLYRVSQPSPLVARCFSRSPWVHFQ